MFEPISISIESAAEIFRNQVAKRLGKEPADVTIDEIIRNSTLAYTITYRERYFNAEDNPRLKRPIRHKAFKLYHFTLGSYMPSILKEGLKRGDVPVRSTADHMPSEDCFNNAVWLSQDLDPSRQKWARLVDGGSKIGYRITVNIDSNDGNLWRWTDLAGHLGIDPVLRAGLRKTGGREYDWWVYLNEPIHPSRFIQIEELGRHGGAGR